MVVVSSTTDDDRLECRGRYGQCIMDHPTPRLVGREDQLRIVDDVLARLDSGRGSILSITGAAGTGKTALLDAAVDRAAAAGTTVLHAVCEPDAERLISALHQLVDGDWSAARPEVRDTVEQLRGRFAAPGPDHDLIELGRPHLDGLVAFFDALLVDAPLLVVLDDAQWADEATLSALRATLRRLEGAALAVFVGARPPLDDLPDPARLIAGGRADHEIVLDDLTPSAGDELLARLVASRPGPKLNALARRAAGNPLLLVELVRSLQLRSRLVATGDEVELIDQAIDEVSLDDLIARQLGALSGPDRELLRTASLLGRTFAPRHLAAATGSALSEGVDGLERLLRAGLLVPVRDDLAFRHDLVRHAVYETIPAPLRVDLHRDLADRLAAAGFPAAVVAAQYLKGARPGDGEAVVVLRQAAREAMATMPGRAGRYLERARELVSDEAASVEIEADLGWARFWAGDVVGAERILSAQIARLGDGPLRLELTGRRAQALFVLGRLSEASEVFDQLAEAGRPPTPGPVSSRRCPHPAARRASDRGGAGRRGRARRGAVARRSASPVPGPRVARLRCCAAGAYVAEGIEQTSAAVELAEADSRLLAHRDMPYLFLMQVLTWADRHDEALAAQRAGLARSEQIGASWHVPVYLGVFSDELARAGRFDDALTEAAGRGRGDRRHGRWVGHGVAVRGQCPRAAPPRRSRTGRGVRSTRRSPCHRRRGQPGGRRRVVGAGALAGRPRRGGGGSSTVADPVAHPRRTPDRAAPTAVRVRVRAGACRPRSEDVGRGGRRRRARWSGLDDCRVRRGGPIHRRCCRRAIRDTIRAALVCARRALPRPLERAAMYEELADPGEAVDDRRFAARSAAAEAAIRLRAGRRDRRCRPASVDGWATSVVPLGPGRPARPVHGWESLTPSETAVVRLVAKGATNAAIAEMLAVSRRTVESHLHHVYRKVDCESRVELALAAAAILDDAD